MDRSSPWAKLIACGINENVVKVVYNMYDKAKCCVKVGETITIFFRNVGMSQGENLSPVFNLMYSPF